MDKVKRFQQQLLQLEAIEFLGIAKILGIEIYEEGEDKEPKPFEEVFAEVCEKYAALSRRQRKNLDKLLQSVVKELSK